MAGQPSTPKLPAQPIIGHVSSPPKPFTGATTGHSREEMAEQVYPYFMHKADENQMWKLLGYPDSSLFMEKYKDVPTLGSMKEAEGKISLENPSRYCALLNELSILVRDPKDEGVIKFFDSPDSAATRHPTFSTCRPDFVAIRLPAKQQTPPKMPWHWSALDATGEILSAKETKTKAYIHAASYTGYLLQARPDLTAVLGIYVDDAEFKLYVTNAFGVFETGPHQWGAPSSGPLLCAWISRLYTPEVDASIKRINSPVDPTFTITEGERIYKGCSVYKAGVPFGRHTVVFNNCRPNGLEISVVIKEQYTEVRRRFEEGPLLGKVHGQNVFPGVVQIHSYSVVKRAGEDLVLEHNNVRRKKTRLAMLDQAEPLMDAETPLDALVAIYDLLEVTRTLYTKRHVLHRDISSGNVLLRAKFPLGQKFSEDLGGMCFASYLLKEKSLDSRAGRLDTRVLLIDFDMSEDCDASAEHGPKRIPRTGTPIFMACVVRSLTYPEGSHMLPPMPQLGEGETVYRSCVGDRLGAFPENSEEHLIIKRGTPVSQYRHSLRHDAESVFWLLLWWCLHAKPDKDKSDDTINSTNWFYLTNGPDDSRNANFILSFPGQVSHSAYAPLDDLLMDMAAQLKGDLSLAKDPHRRKDEYLHEAMQRVILNFLFKNYEEGFMRKKRDRIYRKVQDGRFMKQPKSSGPQQWSNPGQQQNISGQQQSIPSQQQSIPNRPKRGRDDASGEHTDNSSERNPKNARIE